MFMLGIVLIVLDVLYILVNGIYILINFNLVDDVICFIFVVNL